MAAKDQIMRLIFIAQRINAKPYSTIEELAEWISNSLDGKAYKSACSCNTIKRDIEMLRNDFGLNIKFSRSRWGYFLDRTDDGYNNCSFDSLLETFDILSTIGLNDVVPNYIDISTQQQKGTKHLQAINNAIVNNKLITFDYSKFSTQTTSKRTIAPYAIKKLKERWYVIGKDTNEEIRTFGLDRIERLKEESSTFTADEAFNLELLYQHSYGIYSDPLFPVEHVILKFDFEDGGYLKSVPLHSTQQIVREDKESIIISVDVRITFDFIMELLSRSNSLKIIEPQSLKDKIVSIYKKALERNLP